MKNLTRILLFFSLLLIGGGVCGQSNLSKDTLQPLTSISQGGTVSSVYGGNLTAGYADRNKYYTDTVPVMMLVCDTAVFYSIPKTGLLTDPLARANQMNHSVNWIKGYAVRNVTIEAKGSHYGGDYMWFNQEDKYSYSVSYYLADNYWRLTSTYIVWQTR